MIYSTGTISINGNTATGSGTNWTAPASQVRAGQTIIVMSNPVQLFQISSVNSATSMTVTPAVSPALSGQKYGILVSDNISVDGLAQAMSQLIKEYDENIGAWETFATTSANQSITVTINGTAVTIPGIGKLAQKGSNGAVTVADGGTGATNAADARTNLGLGEAAKRDVGTGENQIPDMASFASGDGWMKLPNGKILQYGRGAVTPTLSTQTMRITFSIPFPKKVDCAMLTHSGDGGAPLGAGRGFVMTAEGPTLTGFNSAYRTASTSSTVSMNYSWWAVGE
ncbi:hypothetical protein ARC81_06770 [Escherichia coli]|nr:hypothetical protein ARC81_06770 [Escherichia coli]